MRRFLKQVGILLFDLTAIWLSILLAFSLRFEWGVPLEYKRGFYTLLWLMPLIRFPFFFWLGLYKEIWKYASVRELKRILVAVLSGTTVLSILNGFDLIVNIPRSIVALEGLLCMGSIGILRLIPRFYPTSRVVNTINKERNIVIVGAGDAGAMLLKDALKHPEINVIGFIDDAPEKQGKSLHGKKILGKREKLLELSQNSSVDEFVIAMPSVDRQEIRKLVEIIRHSRKPIKILPGLYEIVDGSVTVSQLREIRIEDLLGRKPIKVDLNEAGKYLEDRIVMVTGAGGSIGSELCRQVAKCHPKELILLGHGENSIYEINKDITKKHPNLRTEQVIADVRDTNKIHAIMERYKPDVIYHAAAHKHVPLMEMNVDEAITNNILGTRNMVEAAERYGVGKFILISTDKAVNPSSVMGASKRLAEMIIQDMASKSENTFVAVRFGNVLGSRGSVVPLFKEQINEGRAITITDPRMTRYFMTIPEASQLVIKAGDIGKGGEVFILDMGEPVRILDLATTLIKLMGLEPDKDVKIEFTGARPGEKLHEELRFNAEKMSKTSYDKIWVLRDKNINEDQDDFNLKVNEIIEAAGVMGNDNLRHSLMLLARNFDDKSATSHSEVAITLVGSK